MSKYFYKDVKVIKYCLKCGVSFRPCKGMVHFGLCNVHRRKYWREEYKKDKEKNKGLRYRIWKRWCEKNLERRRKQALESYHRRKSDLANKKRKHRKVKSDSLSLD